MPRIRVNDVDLRYEITGGSGEPVALVHGSWGDHEGWQQVVPGLAQRFRVLTYDRRGHSGSERPFGHGRRVEDEADLAALLEALDLAPAHVAGNSFGASIVLGLAAGRPDLLRSVAAHEPPLSAVIADDEEMARPLENVRTKIETVRLRLESGDVRGGAQQFVDDIAFGEGAWDTFPAELRQTFVHNAPTWVDECRDAHWNDIDLGMLARLSCPLLLTRGDQSFPWFSRVVEKLRTAVPTAQVHTFAGAAHVPHVTHPHDYVRVVTQFFRTGRTS